MPSDTKNREKTIKIIKIGTGGQSGVHHVVGQSICRLVNRGTAERLPDPHADKVVRHATIPVMGVR